MSRMDRISELIRGTSGITHFEVLDESSGHNVPIGSETHFKLVAVGDVFVQKFAETFFSVFDVFRAKINCRVVF